MLFYVDNRIYSEIIRNNDILCIFLNIEDSFPLINAPKISSAVSNYIYSPAVSLNVLPVIIELASLIIYMRPSI